MLTLGLRENWKEGRTEVHCIVSSVGKGKMALMTKEPMTQVRRRLREDPCVWVRAKKRFEELAWPVSGVWQLLVHTDISWLYRIDHLRGRGLKSIQEDHRWNPVYKSANSQILPALYTLGKPANVTLALTLAWRCFASALSSSRRHLSLWILVLREPSTACALCRSSEFLWDLVTWISSLSKWAKTPEERKKAISQEARDF